MEEVYRACAAAFVIRPVGKGIFEILLVHKPRKMDDWQIPQGGIEKGETAAEAAVREVKEEAGLDVKAVKDTGIIYQYNFPNSYRRQRPDHIKGQRVHFVLCQLLPGAQVQVDNYEIDGHVWILPELVRDYIERDTYLEALDTVIEYVKSIDLPILEL